MFETLLSDALFPFSLALAMLLGLLALELVFALLGGTLLGAGGEGLDTPDLDGPDLDLDLEVDFDGLDVDPADFEMADLDAAEPEMAGATASGGFLDMLGIGRMPLAIWLASILLAFGLSGVVLQQFATALFGGPLPAALVAVPAVVVALWFARAFGGLFARLIPKTETQALSERHLGRRTGIVSQGTAARGRPAEVRVTDRYGNTHYLRAEPLRDGTEIAQGTEVVVLRHRLDDGYRIVAISD